MASVYGISGQSLDEQRRALWGDLDQLYPKGLQDPLLKMVEVVEVVEEPLTGDVDLSPEEVDGEEDLSYNSVFRIASLVDLRVTWTPLGCSLREREVHTGPPSSTPRIVFVVEANSFMDVTVLLDLQKKFAKKKLGSCPSMTAVALSKHRQQLILVELASVSENEANAAFLRELLGDAEKEKTTRPNGDLMSRALRISKEKLSTHIGKIILIQSTGRSLHTDVLQTLRSILATHTVDILQVTANGYLDIDAAIQSLVESSGGIIAVVENSEELFDILKYRTGLCGSLAFSVQAKMVLPPSLSLQEVSGPGIRNLTSYIAGGQAEFTLLSVTDLDEYDLCLQLQRTGKPPYGLDLEMPLQCDLSYVTVWGEEVQQRTLWRLVDDAVFLHGRLSLASQFSEQRRAAELSHVRGTSSRAAQMLLHSYTTLKLLLWWWGRDLWRWVCTALRNISEILRKTRRCL